MEFRALRADELEAWYDYVAFAFNGSREYFMRHWQNDPWHDLEGVRVAVDDGQIVSTVRVFIRQMYLRGVPVPAGGLGEVCTHPEYRHQGLATRLLQDAIRFMEKRKIAISSLHTGRAAPLYAAQGWRSITRYYRRTRMTSRPQDDFHIRPARLEPNADLAALSDLYHRYSRRFNGTFARDHPRYWADWVRAESSAAWCAEKGGTIHGYISVRGGDERLHVREFLASDEMWAHDRGQGILKELIGHAIGQLGQAELEVTYPAPIAGHLDIEGENLEKREGTMYRVIDRSQIPFAFESLVELLHEYPDAPEPSLDSYHVFWDTDGF